jgi:hypothetical protein
MRRLLLALCLIGCGNDKPDGCDPTTEPCTIEGVVSTITVPAGHEAEDTCQSWTLNNETELWVNSITQTNDGAYHHANWFFVPDNMFQLPDGAWSCKENNFESLTAALTGGYLFALSTQSLTESQALPEGSALRIPPYSRVIGSSHFLNATDNPITTTMRLAIHTIPESAVEAKMAPSRMSYFDLNLDAQQKSSFTIECLFDTTHLDRIGAPLQYERVRSPDRRCLRDRGV